MLRRSRRVAYVLAIAATLAGPAKAADIKLMCAVAIKSAIEPLGWDFAAETHDRLTVVYAPGPMLRDRIANGDAFDLAILPRAVMDTVASTGAVSPDSVRILARSLLSLAAKTGAPKPDIGTVAAFGRTMLAADSIAYGDPAQGGSGVLVAQIMEGLGIAAAMKPKTKLVAVPDTVRLVASGEAKYAIANTAVLMDTPGVDVVGPLPPELQSPTDFVFAAGIGAHTEVRQPAERFLAYLLGPHAAGIFGKKGLAPGGK